MRNNIKFVQAINYIQKKFQFISKPFSRRPDHQTPKQACNVEQRLPEESDARSRITKFINAAVSPLPLYKFITRGSIQFSYSSRSTDYAGVLGALSGGCMLHYRSKGLVVMDPSRHQIVSFSIASSSRSLPR